MVPPSDLMIACFFGVLEYINEPLKFIQTWLKTYKQSILRTTLKLQLQH